MENGKVSIMARGGEPMAAVVFGALFFSEMPTLLNLTGLVLTVFALYLLCKPQHTSRPLYSEQNGKATNIMQ